MAGKEIKVSNTYKEKNGFKLNAQWLKNATRSLGSNAVDVLQDISPNVYGVASSAAQIKRQMQTSRVSQNVVTNAIKNNSYVKAGRTAIDNALKDLQSGNFNNTSRSGFSAGGEDDSTSYSFGEIEDSTESTGGTQVQAVVNFNPEGLNSINTSITRQTKFQMQAAKANVDAIVATSSAMLTMNQKNAEASLNMLTNINNSLQAIIKYNNENMSRYIASSMTYYEMMGKIYAPKEKQSGDSRLTGADLIDRKGNFSTSELPKLLKQNFKDVYSESLPGQLTGMLSMMGDQIVANPLKMFTTALMQNVIPKAVKKSTEELDKTFGNFLTELIMKSSDTLRASSGRFGGIKRFLGDVLDINVDRRTKFDTAGKVTTDAAVFDGITRHAISAEIPKYLRESNAYLRELVLLNGGDPDKAVAGSTIFNRRTGTYQKYTDFTKGLMGSINDVVIDTMSNSDFGKSLEKIANSSFVSDDKKGAFNELLERFFIALEKEDSARLDWNRGEGSDINRIVNSLSGDKNLKKILEESVYSTFEHGRGGISMNAARLNAKKRRNEQIKDLEFENLADLAAVLKGDDQPIDEAMASVIYGTDGRTTRTTKYTPGSLLGKITNIEELLDRGINVKIMDGPPFESKIKYAGTQPSSKEDKPKDAKVSTSDSGSEEINEAELKAGIEKTLDEGKPQGKGKKSQWLINMQGHLGNFMHYFIKGDPTKAYQELGGMVGDTFKTAGRTLNDAVIMPLQETLFGKDEETGKVITVGDKVKGMFGNLRDEVATFIMGPKDPKTGKRDSKKKESVLGFLQDGLNQWSQTLFGEEKSITDIKKELTEKLRDNADVGLKGAVAGAGLGLMSGGVLGTLVGGPLTGAVLGAATGIASKSDWFQKLMFGKDSGELDADGNPILKGGIISDQNRKFLKAHKTDIVGSAALGTISGTLTGGGLLGTLVGGPVAGALLGSAVGIAKNSEGFKKFVFGEKITDEGGNTKIIGGILGAFNRAFADIDKSEDNKDRAIHLASRATIGTGTGLLLSLFTPLGPIGGAALGLAGSMVASKNKFRELLFGKESDEGENKGLIHQLGAQIQKTVVAPLAGIAANVLDRAKDAIIDRVFDPLVSLAEPLAGLTRRLYEHVEEKVTGAFDAVKNTVFNVAKLAAGSARDLIMKVFNRKGKDEKGEEKYRKGPLDFVRKSNERASRKKWYSDKYRATRDYQDKLAAMQEEYENLPPDERAKYPTFEDFEKAMAGKMFFNAGDGRHGRRQSREERRQARVNARNERRENINREALIAKLTKGKYSSDSDEARQAALEAYKKTRGYANKKGTMGISDDEIMRLLSIAKPKSGDAKIAEEQLGVEKEQVTLLDKIHGTVVELAKTIIGAPFKAAGAGINAASEYHQNKLGEKFANNETMSDHASNITENAGRLKILRTSGEDGEDISDYSKQFIYRKKGDRRRLIQISNNPDHEMHEVAKIIIDDNASYKDRNKAYDKYIAYLKRVKEEKRDAKIAHKRAKKDWVDETFHPNRGHATGTKNAKEGLSYLGEMGPEILVNKEGAQIVGSHGKEIRHLSSGDKVLSNNDIIKVRVESVSGDAAKAMNNSGIMDVNLVGQTGPIVTYGTSAKLDGSTDNKTAIEKALKRENTLVSYDLIKADNDEITNGNGGGDDEESWIDKLKKMGMLLLGGGIAALIAKILGSKGGEVITDLLDTAGTETKQGLTNIWNTYTNDAYENGTDFGTNLKNETTRLTSIFSDPKTFLLGTDGEADGQTRAFLKGGRQLANNLLNGPQKSGIPHPIKAIKNFIKHPIKGTQNIGSKTISVVKTGYNFAKDFATSGNKLQFLTDAVKGGAKKAITNSDAHAQATMLKKLAKNITGKEGLDAALDTVNEALDVTNPNRRGLVGLFKKLRKYGAEEVSEEAVEKAASKAAQVGAKTLTSEAAEETAEKFAKNTTLKTAAKAIKQALEKAGEVISEKLGKGKGKNIAKKAIKYVDEVLEVITKGMSGKLKTFIMKKLAKLGAVLGVTTGVAATGIGAIGVLAKDGVFLLLGALNASGKGGTARLFRCDQSVVDWKMQLISAAIGGFAETTVGTVIDIVNEIYCAITGDDMLTHFASSMYAMISSEDEEKALNDSQNKLWADYEAYKEGVLKQEYEQFKQQNPNSTLTYDQYCKNVANGSQQSNVMGYDQYNDSTNQTWLSKTWNTVKTGASNLWNSAKTTVSNAWNSAKNWFGNLFGKGGQDEAEDDKRLLEGGRGDATPVPFYSQKDPRWSGITYDIGGSGPETMYDAGCGPAAFAMAASGVGRNIDPVQAAMVMKKVGARDDTGTNMAGISKAADMYGINSNMEMHPSTGFIDSELDAGNPVVLLGRSGGYGGRGPSPYTKGGHYVVATGKDKNGNYIINDPGRTDGMAMVYNKSDVASKTGAAWGFGGKAPMTGTELINSGQYIASNNKGTNGLTGTELINSNGVTRNTTSNTSQTTSNRQKWLNIVRACKQAIAAKKVGYSQKNWITITVGGVSKKVRTDCSGFVGVCMRYYGVWSDNENCWTGNMKRSSTAMKNTGFTPKSWSGWDSLTEGDVLVNPSSHTEIFAYNKNGKHYVYNCGSDSSCNSAVPTVSGKSSYEIVWVPGAPGKNAVTAPSSSNYSYDGVSGDSVATSGTTAQPMSFVQKLGTFLSELGNRAVEGIVTGNWNTDWSGVFDGTSTDSSGTSSESGNSSVSVGTVASEKDIWNALRSNGITAAGAAGTMGNLYAESALNSKNLQQTYERSLGYSDDSYTSAVDSGKYKNFVHDSAGYGLAQWTYHSRKKNLYNYAKSKNKSIGDAGMQIEFLLKELKEGYSGVYNTLKSATSVRKASDAFMTKFERPANQSENAKQKRANYGQKYYDKYAGKGGKGGASTASTRYISYPSYGGRSDIVAPSTLSTGVSNTYLNNRVVTGSSNAGTSNSMNEVVRYLSRILSVLGESSDKLNALSLLQTIADSSGNSINTTNVYTQNNSTTSTPVVQQTVQKTNSSKYAIAEKIAHGGL